MCTGPGTGMVAIASRLGWTVQDGRNLVTDRGRVLNLVVDPPIVVVEEVRASVKRWRWRRIEDIYPSLQVGTLGNGAFMEPIWRLLKSKQNDSEWNEALRGALRSAITNRQWTQERCFAAKSAFATHNR